MVLQALPQQQTLFAGELPVTLLRRDYQIESCQKILSEWELELLRVLCQQPMGAGKPLIIAHKVELIRQLRDHCLRWFLHIEVEIIFEHYEKSDQPIEEGLPVGLFEFKALAEKHGSKHGWEYFKDQEIQSEIAKHPKKIIARAKTLAHQI